jgi:EKC/KEOPS complex subunit CGI121/TPRKB
VWAHLQTHVEGFAAPLPDTEISAATDWARVRKYYKLNGVPAVEGLRTEEDKAREREMLILSAMALRGV